MTLPKDNLAGKKILIIDDDDFVRMALRKMLEKHGCNAVSEAANGVAGLAIFKQEQPDLVITDILMPDKEGLETISDLLRIKPDVNIIAMSGGGVSQNMTFLQLARKIGASATISKPVKPTELLEAIRSIG